ncbi:MAG: TIGR01212 family radical SAM protein [bacterium]
MNKKRYYDFKTYLRSTFNTVVHKIPIDAGFTCPNRDGRISYNGCIYCNAKGSGTGAFAQGISIKEQIIQGQRFLKKRYKAHKFLAYFQSFSNTYAPVDILKKKYDEALAPNDMVGLCIGTRPDCIDDDKLDLISNYKRDYLVWIEYGLQSFNDATLNRINRGHVVNDFLTALDKTRSRNINVCAHIILGLPGETKKDMMKMAQYLGKLDIQGVKIHLLYVIKGTALETLYNEGHYHCLSQNHYIDIVSEFIAWLPSHIIIHRVTSDPHAHELIAPSWCTRKAEFLKKFQDHLGKKDLWQGKFTSHQSPRF